LKNSSVSYQAAKEELKRAVDIVELIGQFVQLRKAGQNFLGLCPFHSEKVPSFTVSPSKQMFHCFGCKKGGDIFAFWMAYHHVSFPQAMRDLAERYHVSLPTGTLGPLEKAKFELNEALLEINEIAAQYFHQLLKSSAKGEPGRRYFARRAIPAEIIDEFRLGYAPKAWDGLIKFLKSKKADLEKARQAGLIIAKEKGGYYDRFRDRVMFPIFNMRGQVVGFGGRVLDDSLPKYLNTPETPVFHKGKLLYGLHASYEAIRKSGCAVIVEGYTDFLALRKNGFHEAVATLGTALTREHIRRLKGYAREAIVVFDPDTAGKSAAMGSLSYFLDEGLPARVALLPGNEDPDSFVNKKGVVAFQGLLENSVPMFDFFIDRKLSEKTDYIENRVDLLKEIIPVLSELRNSAQRSLYTRRLSEKLGIAESALIEELEKWGRQRSWTARQNDLVEKVTASKAKRKDDLFLLNLLVNYPHITQRVINQDFRLLLSDPAVIQIFDSLAEMHAKEGPLPAAEVMDRLEAEDAKERLREAMLMAPFCDDNEVELALAEFEDRIQKIKILEAKKKALKKGDIEGLAKIPKLIRERWG